MGTAFKVERTYLGGQFASSEGVQLDCHRISQRLSSQRRLVRTHVRRKNDGRWRQVQLRDVEGLVEEIGGIELVDRSDTSLRGRLLLLRHGHGLASSHLHACHALRDAADVRRGRRAVAGGLEPGRGGRGELLGSRISAAGGGTGLLLLTRISAITTVAGSNRLRSAELTSSWQLSAHGRVAATAYVEGAGGVSPLLLLASRVRRLLSALRRRRGGRILV